MPPWPPLTCRTPGSQPSHFRTTDRVCPDPTARAPLQDGLIVRRDAHHLTIEFATTLAPDFEAALATILGPS